MSVKNSSDTIGNRTRDVPVCSAVPQPTAPPRAPFCTCIMYKIIIYNFELFTSLMLALLKRKVMFAIVSLDSVLATGPKVRGFDPDRGRWIFKGDKNPEHHFLRRSHVVDLRHVKEPYGHE
jgi:hypothetical protein